MMLDEFFPLGFDLAERVSIDSFPAVGIAGIADQRYEGSFGIQLEESGTLARFACGARLVILDQELNERASQSIRDGGVVAILLADSERHVVRRRYPVEMFQVDLLQVVDVVERARVCLQQLRHELMQVHLVVWKTGIEADALVKVDRQALGKEAVAVREKVMNELMRDRGFARDHSIGRKFHPAPLSRPSRNERSRELVFL